MKLDFIIPAIAIIIAALTNIYWIQADFKTWIIVNLTLLIFLFFFWIMRKPIPYPESVCRNCQGLGFSENLANCQKCGGTGLQ